MWVVFEVGEAEEGWSGRVEVRDGAPRVVSLTFTSPDLQQRHLDDAQVSAFVAFPSVAAIKVELVDGETRVTHSLETFDLYDERLDALLARRRNRRITPDLLERVAEVYRADPTTPTKAVREAFFVSERQAANYVRKARDAGLLPQTTKGRKTV
jgi:hypothetical protein